MAYLTSRSASVPRLRVRDVQDFLWAIADHPDSLISEFGGPYDEWRETIRSMARAASDRIPRGPQETIPPAVAETLLAPLRTEFSDFSLFAMAVGRNEPELKAQAVRLARSPLYGQLLVLIPEQPEGKRNFAVLDPIPAFSVALHSSGQWPGFTFWTPNGTASFVRMSQIDEFTQKLRSAIEGNFHRLHGPWPMGPANFDRILNDWNQRTQPTQSRRLLHLSDLHFGTKHAIENQSMLTAQLTEVVKLVDRIVITGDLFDSPKPQYFTLYSSFRDSITRLSQGRAPLAITGNHDQRLLGILGKDYEQVAKIGPPRVELDDSSEMIFLCFNSSVKGSWARGRITGRQFRQIGAEYLSLRTSRPDTSRFLPVVLVHHHPFSFETAPESWVQRALSAFGISDERLLTMADAEELHRWCLDWNVQTILHGHKHKARYAEKQIVDGDRKLNLTAIGCGSSLGAEGTALSYNMLEWDSRASRWVASSFESVNGGAFREILLSVSPG